MGLLVEKIMNIYYNNQQNKFNVHCIGHSLGSHICALAGQYTKSFGYILDRLILIPPIKSLLFFIFFDYFILFYL